MKRLYVYILKNFFGPLVATFFVSTFVLFMQFLWLYVDDLVGKGLETMVVAEFVFYAILNLLPMAVPLSVLLASLMTFGNMGEKLELLSVKAAGVSLFKAMTPVIVLVIAMSLGMLYFSHNVYPETHRKMRVLLWDIKRAKPELTFKDDVFNSDLPGLTVRVGGRDMDSGMLQDILIYDTRDNQDPVVTRADSGLMKTTEDQRHLVLTLFNGRTYGVLKKGKKQRNRTDVPEPFKRDTFQKQVVLFDIDENFKRSSEDAAKNQYFGKDFVQLAKSYDSLVSDNNVRAERFYQAKISRVYNGIMSGGKPADVQNTLRGKTLFNLDSIFVMMPMSEQARSVNYSIAAARRIKNDIMERLRESTNKLYESRKHLYELNHRISLSILSLIMFFIGAPLGAIVRKGGLGLPVILSVFFFILYYIIDNFGRHLTIDGGYSAYIGAWLATFILLPIGVFLTRQATSDSVIMNVENYYNIFKKLFNKNKRNEQD